MWLLRPFVAGATRNFARLRQCLLNAALFGKLTVAVTVTVTVTAAVSIYRSSCCAWHGDGDEIPLGSLDRPSVPFRRFRPWLRDDDDRRALSLFAGASLVLPQSTPRCWTWRP